MSDQEPGDTITEQAADAPAAVVDTAVDRVAALETELRSGLGAIQAQLASIASRIDGLSSPEVQNDESEADDGPGHDTTRNAGDGSEDQDKTRPSKGQHWYWRKISI